MLSQHIGLLGGGGPTLEAIVHRPVGGLQLYSLQDFKINVWVYFLTLKHNKQRLHALNIMYVCVT